MIEIAAALLAGFAFALIVAFREFRCGVLARRNGRIRCEGWSHLYRRGFDYEDRRLRRFR